MKNPLTFFILFLSIITFSQNTTDNYITGKIIVEGTDVEGLTIFNKSSGLGTVANGNGSFTIKVNLKDLIEVRGLEYKNVDFIVNDLMLKSKKVNVFLIEEVEKLDEIVIKSNTLSGNLKEDLKKVKTFNLKQNNIYFGLKNKEKHNFSKNKENRTTLPNTLVDGLNITNIVDQLLIPLFRTEVIDKKRAGIPEVPVKSIKYYLGSKFLVENFNIPEYRVEEFIRYVEDDVFDFDLLNYGHEIEFLELLSKKSKSFLKK